MYQILHISHQYFPDLFDRLRDIEDVRKKASEYEQAELLTAWDGVNWADQQIATAFSTSLNTVVNLRQRFVEHGFDAALGRKKRRTPPRKKSLDGHQEARLIALRCSAPPTGYAKWTLQLLAEKLVELKVVDQISRETVRQVL